MREHFRAVENFRGKLREAGLSQKDGTAASAQKPSDTIESWPDFSTNKCGN